MAFIHPLIVTLAERVLDVGATADASSALFRAPFAGTITEVTYAADSAVTGDDTDSRGVVLINKGAAGGGAVAVAALDLETGTDLVACDEKAITLSVTAADLVVAEGDILAWVSTHVSATGLADPGGMIFVSMSRA